ncbi:MAG: chloride channel protein, partial [Betaproteobacteria bacterium]|nr:chloride channel protein [Betaproteobacteria bacterium]
AHFFPHVPLGALVILGMAGYFTGVVQTPITAFAIIMEMTSNQGILLPLIAVAFIARGASHLVCPEPVYQALAVSFRHKPEAAPQAALA